jgi:hypothetical protein
MRKIQLAAAVAGAIVVATLGAGTASAQTADWPLGAELRGATVQVQLPGGVVNTVQFYPDGTASLTGRSGQVVSGNWFVEGQRLCLQAAGERECWPYRMAFQTGQPVTLTSDCAATSTWTALSTQQPPMQQPSGERG